MARFTSAISCFKSFSAPSSFVVCAFICISPFAAILKGKGSPASIERQSEESLKTLQRAILRLRSMRRCRRSRSGYCVARRGSPTLGPASALASRGPARRRLTLLPLLLVLLRGLGLLPRRLGPLPLLWAQLRLHLLLLFLRRLRLLLALFSRRRPRNRRQRQMSRYSAT